MTNNLPLRETLVGVLNRVLVDSGRTVRDVKDEDRLSESLQLDSLDLAVLVVQLQQELGVDPFRHRAPAIQTFGDLLQAYQQELSAAEARS